MKKPAKSSKAKTSKSDELPLPELVARAIRAREVGKMQYARADRLVAAAREQLEVGEVVELTEEIARKYRIKQGTTFRLVDNYANKDVVFRPVGVRRYELEEIAPAR